MASPRISSSPAPRMSPGRGSPIPAPMTPESTFRSRFPGTRLEEHGDISPTATTISNLSRSTFRGMPLPFASSSSFGTPVRKVVIRADPALVTCFDPADKELYALWTPKR